MMTTRKPLLLRALRASILLFTLSSFAQGLPQNSTQDIKTLLRELSEQTKKPSELLDPDIEPAEAARNLEPFQRQYELNVTPTSEIAFTGDDKASVPVRLHYKSDQGNLTDVSTVANFVQRNGVWYFASFDFVHWKGFLVIISVLLGAVGIAYAVLVLFIRDRMRRAGIRGVATLKSWIPFLWPSILSQTRAK